MSVVRSVVLAAGMGTRMQSDRAKVLHEVGGKAMIHWVLSGLREAGVESHVVVVGYQHDVVESAVAAPGVTCVLQEPQLGTGHAVQCAEASLAGDGAVLVTVGDAPLVRASTYAALLDAHGKSGAAATVLSAEMSDPSGYGRILRDGAGQVTAIVEDRDATEAERQVREINSGIYVFRADDLRWALAGLTAENAQGEYYLTDTLALLVERGRPVAAHLAPSSAEIMGVNDPVQLAEAGRVLVDRLATGADERHADGGD